MVAEIAIPPDHGESACMPPFREWATVLQENRRRVSSWSFSVGGTPVALVRDQARRESLATASCAAERMDGTRPAPADPDAPIVVTGHQPLLYHPGVWAKVMLADRLAHEVGGTAIECVVDSDRFERIALTAPCAEPEVARCAVSLVEAGTHDAYFASAQAPDAAGLEDFAEESRAVLRTLPAPGAAEHFERFAGLLALQSGARDAPVAVTAARRAYEKPLGMTYLPLPITDQAATPAFSLFYADLAFEAERFRDVHNEALSRYRKRHKIRSSARPFPDLGREGDETELPLWHLDGRTRAAVWARRDAEETVLTARGALLTRLAGPDDAAGLAALPGTIAPRAVSLTMFERILVADLFIHGTGGAAYESLTDEIIRGYWGIEPPGFVSATLTLRLPFDAPASPDKEIADLQQRVHRIEHNPDQLLAGGEAPEGLAAGAVELAAEKAELVTRIAVPGADKKALGARIRETNEKLAVMFEPLADETRREIARLERVREDSSVLTDRTYPFCLWDPRVVSKLLFDSL